MNPLRRLWRWLRQQDLIDCLLALEESNEAAFQRGYRRGYLAATEQNEAEMRGGDDYRSY